MLAIEKKVKEIDCRVQESIDFESLCGTEPIIFRGLVEKWPAVVHACQSTEKAIAYLKRFYTDRTVVMYSAEKEKNGRFFYNVDCTGLDFKSEFIRLDTMLDGLLAMSSDKNKKTQYVWSTSVDICLPGFRDENDLNLNHLNPLVSIWIGNQTKVAAHFDAPENMACCVAGKRTFTLFPIEEIENLYIGPLDITPSGQIISLVDFDNPDFEKFPKFSKALNAAQVANLSEGDALFLPSMWWHHVESKSDFNILVNYWWRFSERFMDAPMNVLRYAILSLRDLPQHEKEAWRKVFDYYVFSGQEDKYDHIPEAAKGILNKLDDTSARQLRAWLLNRINK